MDAAALASALVFLYYSAMGIVFSWTDVPERADAADVSSAYSLLRTPERDIAGRRNVPPHLFIEGDNYPVLRLLSLRQELAGQVRLIYIDPPYNTGKKSFAYDDARFRIPGTGADADRHSAWLSFMARRLAAARELLREDGCIFIAIGREELYHLKLLCDQIFGEANFVNDFMWLHGKGKKDRWSRTMQQSNLCYAKRKKFLKPFSDWEEADWARTNPDGDARGPWFSGSISFDEARSNPAHRNFYEAVSPSGVQWRRQWLVPREEFDALAADGKIYWGAAPAYDGVPRRKIFNGERTKIIPKNIIGGAGTTRSAQRHLDALLGGRSAFDNPKPAALVRRLLEMTGAEDDALVLDFFAGSGTTLEAVSQMNRADGGTRRCILVQQPEPVSGGTSGAATIADICRERCRRVLEADGAPLECAALQERQ
ncbi:MAG: site-specific DNA-methyltransferase [Treponemataceae bacterium]|nr:site-specific DNA-methyltransferase [Treponemataceae bacterium]